MTTEGKVIEMMTDKPFSDIKMVQRYIDDRKENLNEDELKAVEKFALWVVCTQLTMIDESVLPKFQEIRNQLIKELDRRIAMIQSEPDGLVRETMIANLLVDI
jgi:hypothetical protein